MEEEGQTIQEILDIEAAAFSKGEEKYGYFFKNSIAFNDLLNNFVKEVNPDAHIFVMFLAQVKKFHLLALLSFLRGHHVQGMLNMRQVLEAGANAAYGLGNPNHEDYMKNKPDGTLSIPKNLTSRRYAWLNKNYPPSSEAIKRQKDNINDSCAHSNIVYVFNNFEMKSDKRKFSMSFFDKKDEYLIQTDLWFTGNVAMGLMDLFNGVNKNVKRIKFIDGFESQLLNLEKENHRLKAETAKHPRYVAAMERAQTESGN